MKQKYSRLPLSSWQPPPFPGFLDPAAQALGAGGEAAFHELQRLFRGSTRVTATYACIEARTRFLSSVHRQCRQLCSCFCLPTVCLVCPVKGSCAHSGQIAWIAQPTITQLLPKRSCSFCWREKANQQLRKLFLNLHYAFPSCCLGPVDAETMGRMDSSHGAAVCLPSVSQE